MSLGDYLVIRLWVRSLHTGCSEVCAVIADRKPRKGERYCVLSGNRVICWAKSQQSVRKCVSSDNHVKGLFNSVFSVFSNNFEAFAFRMCDAPIYTVSEFRQLIE